MRVLLATARKVGTSAMTITTLVSIVLSGCASGPTIHTNYDKSLDFSAYKTFGFVSGLGTEREGYSTFITNNFKRAVSNELEARGYTYAKEGSDLLVNFSTNVRHESAVQTFPAQGMGPGYYDYRTGMYATPTFGDQVFVDHYSVGTVNVDIVDAKRKQLIWSGLAEGVLSEETMRNPGPAIHRVVTMLFDNYPVKPKTPTTNDSTK